MEQQGRRIEVGTYLGLALVTLVTMTLEIVTARVLSVISWYHLSFFAVSIAMLGMTAGAIYVYLRQDRLPPARARALLPRQTLFFAASVPLSHLLIIRLQPGHAIGLADPLALAHLILLTAAAAVPYFLSGIVVAVTLTRVGLPIGRTYFFDLLGAAAGCLGAIALLQLVDPTSATFALGALAALGGVAYAGTGRGGRLLAAGVALAALLAAIAAYNGAIYPAGLGLTRAKGKPVGEVAVDRWNVHSRVTATPIRRRGEPFYWGPGRHAPRFPVRGAVLKIDGEAGAAVTEFAGRPRQAAWIEHDVTSLAYTLRGGGDVAVIGVGGGRDLLAGVAHRARSIVGVEINAIFVELLRGRYRDFSALAGRPEVRLVHDDGRSFMARTRSSFDLIQMSLIDTWAATSAGAMTLTENGLYTVEAWRTFVSRLRPGGVFTVSRWFKREDAGEVARLVSLAVGTLLAEGVPRPEEHLVLAVSGRICTLILAPRRLSRPELARLRRAVEERGFRALIWPGERVEHAFLRRLVGARSAAQLAVRAADPVLDLSPPTDERPFFFNVVRPRAWFSARPDGARAAGGVIHGNRVAGRNLRAILIAVVALVALSIALPLLLFGRGHRLGARTFTASACYFAAIGLGFMLIEIGLMQRFTVLLGHPVWSLAIVLLSMILFTGVGSLLSDRWDLSRGRRALALPLVAAAVVLAEALALQQAIELAMAAPLWARALTALGFTTPVGLVLGFFFPVGMRLVRRRSVAALPWMWGLNGGFGVLGGVCAVVLSIALGISWTILIGAACYAALLLPVAVLRGGPGRSLTPRALADARRGDRGGPRSRDD